LTVSYKTSAPLVKNQPLIFQFFELKIALLLYYKGYLIPEAYKEKTVVNITKTIKKIKNKKFLKR
jgi:hypothetical protein